MTTVAEIYAGWDKVRRETYPDLYAPQEVTAHPAPEHTSRDPWPDGVELPRAAATLKRHAEAAGWAVAQTYSRGWSVHGTTGKPSAYGERFALRMVHPDTRCRCIVFYWTKPDGKTAFESALIVGPTLPPYAGCNVTEIKDFIGLAGRVLPSWIEQVQWRRTLADLGPKVWADYCGGKTLKDMAERHEQPKTVIMKIVQDARAAGKAKPTKSSGARKESGG